MVDGELSSQELAGRVQALEFLASMMWANSLTVRPVEAAAERVALLVSEFADMPDATAEGNRRMRYLGDLALTWLSDDEPEEDPA